MVLKLFMELDLAMDEHLLSRLKMVRTALESLAGEHGLRFVAPPLWLCTDNAAMIAWAGAERFAAGLIDPLDVPARARWPLDPEAEKVRGAGVKA